MDKSLNNLNEKDYIGKCYRIKKSGNIYVVRAFDEKEVMVKFVDRVYEITWSKSSFLNRYSKEDQEINYKLYKLIYT